MTERDINKPETAENVGQELLKFVEEAEFGSPRYQAVSDYIYLEQSLDSLKQQRKMATTKEEGSEERSSWDSRVRISENKIAILELQIYQNQSRIKGYDSAYINIEIGLEHDLKSAAGREAQVLFGDDEEQKSSYVAQISHKYFDKIKDAVYAKRD